MLKDSGLSTWFIGVQIKFLFRFKSQKYFFICLIYMDFSIS